MKVGAKSRYLKQDLLSVWAFFLFLAEHTLLFSQLIARTAKDIELLIDSLPSEESSAELQMTCLQTLEQENAKAASQLEEIVRKGEAVLQEIQAALHDIAQSQLDTQKLK